MLFVECRITDESHREFLDIIGRFPAFPGIQVIDEILESLLIPISLLQLLCNWQKVPANV